MFFRQNRTQPARTLRAQRRSSLSEPSPAAAPVRRTAALPSATLPPSLAARWQRRAAGGGRGAGPWRLGPRAEDSLRLVPSVGHAWYSGPVPQDTAPFADAAENLRGRRQLLQPQHPFRQALPAAGSSHKAGGSLRCPTSGITHLV